MSLPDLLSAMIPELLEANGTLAGDAIREVPINLIAHRELSSLRE